MEVQRINPEGMSKPLGAYSQVTRRGSIVTTAGLIPTDAEGNIVGEGDIQAQTRKTLENMKTALAAAGASFKDVLKTTVYLSDMSNYKEVQPIYNEYFGENPAARATIGAEMVLPSLLIEIEAIAVIGD